MSALAYTLPQIAEQLGKSERWVRDLITDRQLVAKRAGKSLIVLADDYASFLERLPDADD